MVNLVRLEKKLREKGINNIEITKHKQKYHVLHICQHGRSVPLIIVDEKETLLDYLKQEYGLDINVHPKRRSDKEIVDWLSGHTTVLGIIKSNGETEYIKIEGSSVSFRKLVIIRMNEEDEK